MDALTLTLDFVEENKLDMSGNTYLEICNILKTCYDRSSIETLTLKDIQGKMNAFDIEHGMITKDDKKLAIEKLYKRTPYIVHFVGTHLHRLKELLLNNRYVSYDREYILLYIEERNRRCRNHTEYVQIKRMFEGYYDICPFMGLYD